MAAVDESRGHVHPRIPRGRGDATTLRQPRPASSLILQPTLSSSARARSREKNGPIGFVGVEERRVRRVHLTCVMNVTTSLRKPARGSSLAKASSSRKPSDP